MNTKSMSFLIILLNKRVIPTVSTVIIERKKNGIIHFIIEYQKPDI